MSKTEIPMRLYSTLREDYARQIAEILKNDDELLFGIRHKAIHVYYHGGRILKACENTLEINEDYDKEHKTKSNFNDITEWKQQLCKLKTIMKNSIGTNNKEERYAQQKIIMSVNRNKDSEYYFIDMEYSAPGVPCGRFDMIAIRKEHVNGKYPIALVELKYGDKTFRTSHKIKDNGSETYGSGIVGHGINLGQYLSVEYKDARERLREEIFSMINGYKDLGLPQGVNLSVPKSKYEIDVDNIKTWLLCVACPKNTVDTIKRYLGLMPGAKYTVKALAPNIDLRYYATEENTIDNLRESYFKNE